MIRRKRYSRAVADLFPETGGWVDASKHMDPTAAANALLAVLTEQVGSETKARAILADIPEAKAIVALLPVRKRGRPVTATKQQKDDALLTVYDWKASEGMTNREFGQYAHAIGMGASAEAVERRLYRLL